MPDLRDRFTWFCPPPEWSLDDTGEVLHLCTAAGTDFWRRPHAGILADNGHFFRTQVEGDFVLSARVAYRPVHQYDQAGLMVRIGPECWLKTSVECELEADALLGAVVTNNGYSDWSTQNFPAGPGEVWLRVRREGPDYTVEASRDGEVWSQIRFAHLQENPRVVEAGFYACSPKGAGFNATFTAIEPGLPG